MKSIAYFVNWAIYDRNYQPADIPVSYLNYLLYAFADIDVNTGNLVMQDPYADIEKHYPEDSWNEPGNNAYGCVKQIYKLKRANRNLKVLLSIGGWTYAHEQKHFDFASDPEKRKNFVSSSIELMKNYAWDGLDIDWEYPANDDEAGYLVSLLKETREGLDQYAEERGLPKEKFYLTVAAPAGLQNVSILHIKEMDAYLSWWNIMCYDYSGSWSKVADHSSNVYGGETNTDQAMMAYLNGCVAADKLILGCPLYGRAFEDTNGPGFPFNGVGPGEWEAGVWDYKKLPLSGAVESFDDEAIAAWSYDDKKREMMFVLDTYLANSISSYDTPESVVAKVGYIKKESLGGIMWWETSGDNPVSNQRSLIRTAVDELGGKEELEFEENTIDYPDSIYDNIKNGLQYTN
ncbi:Endochitinase B1 [Neolecta irregularis DAH-3]|uniref:chitinase n=1 Tax=Neolecta irregularis (strain DAH-3) TaxID=1198029 RepID=A0A1U7LRB7_NEOID|nr:Endochitinase B1 [Neolecta irregularis DAH-3]|eukprot:OLL25123.1 Endochitinase B1 [Neolecta irregularis DAH-3]